MKYLAIIFFLFSSCSSDYNQAITFFPNLEIKNKIFYQKNDPEPFTGISGSTYSDGNPYVTASFTEGKINGTYTAWYSTGQKMGETNYKNGKKEGIATAWHENGEVASKVRFKNDQREGKLEVFYPNGQLNTEAFFKADKLDSTYTRWDIDGNVVSVEVYEAGELVVD